MRGSRRTLGWILLVIALFVGGVASCDAAWFYSSRASKARCVKSAAEFMGRLKREDWAWLGRRFDDSASSNVARLRELRASHGPVQSWSIDHWYGYPFPNSGGVALKVTRRGVSREGAVQMITSDPPRILGYYESR